MAETGKVSKVLCCPVCKTELKSGLEGDPYLDMALHLTVCPGVAAEKPHKRITDVVPEEALKGNLITMDEILDKDILVTGMTLRESSFKEDQDYISLTIDLGGEEKVVNTGAVRVVQAFKAAKAEDFPFYAKFEKIQLPNGKRVYRVA